MRINGEEKHIDNSVKLSELLLELGYDIERVAVEKNGEIVPKRLFLETVVCDADRLEVVRFVGGG